MGTYRERHSAEPRPLGGIPDGFHDTGKRIAVTGVGDNPPMLAHEIERNKRPGDRNN